jgi:hypothetical protein
MSQAPRITDHDVIEITVDGNIKFHTLTNSPGVIRPMDENSIGDHQKRSAGVFRRMPAVSDLLQSSHFKLSYEIF